VSRIKINTDYYSIFYYIELIANIAMENVVEAIMSTELETIDVTETAQEAAKKMNGKRISSVLVVDKKKGDNPIGIVTERDLVSRICAAGTSSKDVQVQQIMSSPIATIEKQSTIEAAADLMLSNKIRHLLVVDQGRKPVGIIAPSDLNKYLRANINMDEVNARILEALEDEDMAQL
jgi:CBS domain-containing protein